MSAKTKSSKRIKKPSGDGERKLAKIAKEGSLAERSREVIADPIPEQSDLQRAIINWDNEHQLAKHWDEERKKTGKELLPAVKAQGGKETAETDREKLTVAVIEQERTSVDPEKLKKALGAKKWSKITTPQLDSDKLEAAIKLGEVDPNIVASCSSTNTSEYLKVTSRRAKKR